MARAQHIDYVITAKNDTINCNMVKSVSFGGLQYQISDDDDFIKIREGQIKEYQVTDDSTIYVNKILSVKKKPIFCGVKHLARSVFIHCL